MLSASSPIAIYRVLIDLLEETSLQDKKVYISLSNIFFTQAGQVMIRHPRGESSISWLFYFLLIIPRLPVNLAKMKCGRGLAIDFTILQGFHTKSYDGKSFLTNAPNDRFRWEKVYDLS